MNTVSAVALWRCYYTLLNYQLTLNAHTQLDIPEHLSVFQALPNPLSGPIDNYGNPLFVNELTDLLRVQLANCIYDLVIPHVLKNTCDAISVDEKDFPCSKSWENTYGSLLPVAYRVLIISAFKGKASDRNKFIESHSAYSNQMVALYPQPEPTLNA